MNNSPSSNEVEVTLIGTGGGYGESIVIKIGFDKWIIIDSCINPLTKESLAISYLNEIGVNLSQVILIICTHWHNDHIKGLARTLEQCVNAEFSFSAVNDLNKFLFLCGLDEQKLSKGSVASTTEFANCLKIINNRNAVYTKASSNLLLLRLIENGVEFQLFALSPSPKTVNDFDSEISELITEFGKRNTAVIKKTPNEKSVALLLKFGDQRVLLGADLEVGISENEGWRYVVSKCKVFDEVKASLYKVPHHGSSNGYMPEIFESIINENSILKITPFGPSSLPRIEMLDIYSNHSKDIYLTSSPTSSKKAKKRDKAIEKIINQTAKSLIEVKYSQGIVRSRINFVDKNQSWKTELFYNAIRY